MVHGSEETVAFRLWPPIAVGAPLLVGWLATQLLGDPAALGGWRVWLGWTLVLLFVGWNGWSLWLFGRHDTGLLGSDPPRGTVPARAVRCAVRRLHAAGASLAVNGDRSASRTLEAVRIRCLFCEPGWMDARREVIQAAEARALALAQGDADRLAQLLHEDFRWTSHAGETFSRHDYIRRNTMESLRWQAQHLSDVRVTVVGDAAVLHAEVTDVVALGDDTQSFRMPMTQVWVRQEGGWRCLAGHAGPRRS